MTHIGFGYPDQTIAPLHRIPAGGGPSGYLVTAGTVSGKQALDTFVGLRLTTELTEQDGRVHVRLLGYRLSDGGYLFDLPTVGLAGAVSDGELELGLRPGELYSVLAVVVDDSAYDQQEVDARTRDRVDRHLDDIAFLVGNALKR